MPSPEITRQKANKMLKEAGISAKDRQRLLDRMEGEVGFGDLSLNTFQGSIDAWRAQVTGAFLNDDVAVEKAALKRMGGDPDKTAEHVVPPKVPKPPLGSRLMRKMDPEMLKSMPEIQVPSLLDRLKSRFFGYRVKKWAKRLGLTVLFGSLLSSAVAVSAGIKGVSMARKVDEHSKSKLSVALYADGGDMTGYLHGWKLRERGVQSGNDKAVPINPEDMEKGGALYNFAEGLIQVEDQGHRDGVTSLIGVSPKLFLSVFKYIISGGNADINGRSTIADQAFGAMQDNLPYLFDRKGMSRTYDRDLKIAEKLLLKKNDTMGGIGLNFIKTPEEILALYATFAFFGYEAQGIEAFVSIYWGFDGIYDPRITPGHLFLLSSFIKRPWNSSEEVWQHSVGRAKLAADRVYAKDGVITGWDGTEYTIEEVYAQIEGARPKTYAEAKAEGRHSFSPRHGYDGGALTAAREMRERFGDDAREEVQGVETSLEGRIQGKMVKKGEGALRKLSDRGPLVYGDVFNERGEAVSIYAGFINENGNLEVLSKDVFSFERMYGSVGKLILVAALAKKGITVDSDDPLVQEFLYNLMHSRREIIQNAKDLGVSEEDVASLIECFGTPHSGMTDPITAAAMGTFDTSHYDLAAMMMAARTGEPMPRPHVVTGYFLRDGRYVTVEPEYSEDAHTCASLIHTPSSVDGGESETWRWFQVPLSDGGTSDSRGTLWRLNGLTDRASIAGKTGTVGKKRSRGGVGETNMTTVVFGTGPVVNSSGEVEVPALYGVQSIGYLDLFDSEGNMRDIGGQFSAGNLVSPVVRDVLQTTRHPQASDDLRSDMGL